MFNYYKLYKCDFLSEVINRKDVKTIESNIKNLGKRT